MNHFEQLENSYFDKKNKIKKLEYCLLNIKVILNELYIDKQAIEKIIEYIDETLKE